MRIQHNIAALNSHRQLSSNNSAVSKNLEKLSSGYKINRAGDDAAGLAISEKMRAQITGLDTAQKNAQDGISLIQTAEGALTEVHSMLNRMVELADQSANGTYKDDDRAQLQKEIQSLSDEIDRISQGTNFNGINLLDGSLGGAGDSAKVTIGGYDITGLDPSITKVEFKTTAGSAGDPAAVSKVEIKDGVLIISGNAKNGAGAELSNADLEKALKNAGYSNAKVGGGGAFTTQAATNTTKVEASSATIGGTLGKGFSINFTKGETGLKKLTLTAVDGKTNAVGITNKDGELDIKLDSNKSYTAAEINKMLSDNGAGAMTVAFSGSKSATAIAAGLGAAGGSAIADGTGVIGSGLTLQIGDTADAFNQLTVKVGSMSASSLGIGGIDISTQTGGKDAVETIKKAINSVSSTRGDLGALQNRLEHTINNLGVTTENMTAAESRIRDVDMAKEMMTYTKNNILVQASQAMLAQANQLPQGVLQLLQ